tara:strand:+ start:1238 stop:1486 length:249 start_codon:yes stop_codon:yes gene_type:complete
MDIVKLTISFPNISAKDLEAKMKGSIEKYGLRAEYKKNTVSIIGPKHIINVISHAYQTQQAAYQIQKAMGDFGLNGFKINFG